ncbi:MAG: helicase SNF2 [Planctomycetaceae bacterium]|nr:helicase SNF2 [Planctomycetaceae bacterium]
MSLAEVLEGKFRGDIRFRGAAYVQAERVAITRVTAERVFGLVRDGVEYQTQLTRNDEDGLRMHCSCATGNQEIKCKHLWATILATDDGGYVTGSPKPGYIPPFWVESEPLTFEELDDWEDDVATDVIPQTVARRTATRVAPPKPKLRDWEQQLVDLRSSMDVGGGDGDAAVRDREIFFEVDVDRSREDRQLVIEVSQRQRRSNGQWGKLKPLKVRPGKLEEIEHEDDRRILAYITGGTPERSNWYAQQAQYQAAVNRFQVPYELSELVLPMMSETGRFRFRGDDSKAPIEWDDGEPWEFLMRVGSPNGDEEWQLDGWLRRTDEELSVNIAKLVIPGGLVFTDAKVARLEHFGGDQWIEMLLKNQSIKVPDGEEVELVDKLLDMPSLPRLELPPKLRLEEVNPEPEYMLTLHSPNGPRWQQERLRGEIHFDYLGALVRGSSPQTAIVQREQGRCILRNRRFEDQAWTELQENGFRRLLDRRRGNHDIEISARDLGPAVRVLINNGWLVRAEGQKVHQPSEMKFRIQSGIDWFELHADIDFEGRSIAFPELLSALARGDSTIRLDDGSLGIIPEEWLQQYGLLSGLGTQEEDHLRFATNQAGLLDALLQAQDSVEKDEQFQNLIDRLESFEGVEEVTEPEKFEGELRPYQREGLGWLKFLEDFQFGGCLADDMGLGKTVQLLALLEDRYDKSQNKLHPTLIVVPKSLLFNWMQEIERFTPRLKALDYTGLERAKLRDDFKKYHVIMTTYGTLRRDIMALKDYRFDRVVLDEAQTIKNSGSQVAKASRLLQADHRIALSGTPIENHLGDMWSIFEFLNPGMLGRSSAFKLYASDSTDKESRGMLAKALRPFILRRTKGQVANDLPEKFEQTIYCDMGDEQERQYKEMRDHYRDSLMGLVQEQGLAKSKMHVLEALLRLRQVACHPGLLNDSLIEEPSAKLDVLCPYLKELIQEGHKSLVFSQFTSMLSIVKQHLDKHGIVYEYLDGQTRNRQAVVERFQEAEDCHVFLISLKAGGLGLNLTAADYVFLLDPWWNPAVEAQAIDRAHRVGQTKQVFAYRLICRNTVEEKITDLQGKKRDLADAILEENSRLLRNLSSDDLNLLLS